MFSWTKVQQIIKRYLSFEWLYFCSCQYFLLLLPLYLRVSFHLCFSFNSLCITSLIVLSLLPVLWSLSLCPGLRCLCMCVCVCVCVFNALSRWTHSSLNAKQLFYTNLPHIHLLACLRPHPHLYPFPFFRLFRLRLSFYPSPQNAVEYHRVNSCE